MRRLDLPVLGDPPYLNISRYIRLAFQNMKTFLPAGFMNLLVLCKHSSTRFDRRGNRLLRQDMFTCLQSLKNSVRLRVDGQGDDDCLNISSRQKSFERVLLFAVFTIRQSLFV